MTKKTFYIILGIAFFIAQIGVWFGLHNQVRLWEETEAGSHLIKIDDVVLRDKVNFFKIIFWISAFPFVTLLLFRKRIIR
jgi:hypothetical protein